jgi:hypothetical protein
MWARGLYKHGAHFVCAEINFFNDMLSFKCTGYKLCETRINYFYHLHNFRHDLIYDVLSTSAYMALNGRLDKWWIGKCCVEGTGCCPKWGSVWAFSAGSDETHEKNSVDFPTDKRIRCLPNTLLQPTLLGYYYCIFKCVI